MFKCFYSFVFVFNLLSVKECRQVHTNSNKNSTEINDEKHDLAVSPVTINITKIIDKGTQQLEDENNEMDTGAVTRAILVFVVISALFLLYVGYKTYRGKKVDKRRVVVQKYGVRARRSDMEMVPLPLSDDEEDETVFDLSANTIPK